MTDQSSSQNSSSSRPQCYNCGSLDHWAVACHEPTRETPAGYLAWKNSTSSGQHGGSNSFNRESVITKYGTAPPPVSQGPHYQGYSGFQPPYSSYPYGSYNQNHTPPANTYPIAPPVPVSHAHGPPPPRPPFQEPYGISHPAPPPPHHAPASYPPPHGPPFPALPGYYAPQPPPQPPPSVASTHYGYNYNAPHHAGYPAPLPPPTPPPHFGHSGNPSSVPRMGFADHSSQSPPQSQVPSHSRHGPAHSSASRHRASNFSQTPRPKPQSQTPRQTLSQLTHSLPPGPSLPAKPPTPVSDHQTDQWSKKKRDRHHRRDQRQKDPGLGRRSAENRHRAKNKRQGSSPPKSGNPSPEDRASDDRSPQEHDSSPASARSEASKPCSSQPSDNTSHDEDSHQNQPAVDEVDDSADLEWELQAIFQEPEQVHPADEVGAPLPSEYTDEVLLPRKWDAPCIESDFVTVTNLDAFIKPVRETEHWSYLRLDPVFLKNGQFPRRPSSCDTRVNLASSEPTQLHENAPREDQDLKANLRSSVVDSPNLNYRVDDASINDEHSEGTPITAARSPEHRTPQTRHGYDRSASSASRNRDMESDNRGASPVKRKRFDSPDSDSSDLSSLEAELLGRSRRRKPSSSSPPKTPIRSEDRRQQQQRRLNQSAARRARQSRAETNSAYSRRW